MILVNDGITITGDSVTIEWGISRPSTLTEADLIAVSMCSLDNGQTTECKLP